MRLPPRQSAWVPSGHIAEITEHEAENDENTARDGIELLVASMSVIRMRAAPRISKSQRISVTRLVYAKTGYLAGSM